MSFSSCYQLSSLSHRLDCICPHHCRRRRSRIGQRPLWCHEEVWRPSSLKARSANDSRLGLQWHFAVRLVPAAARGPPPQAEENPGVGLERSRFRKPSPASEAPDNNRGGDVLGRSAIHMARHTSTRPGPTRLARGLMGRAGPSLLLAWAGLARHPF